MEKTKIIESQIFILHDFRLYQKYTKFKCLLVQDKFVNHPAGVPDF